MAASNESIKKILQTIKETDEFGDENEIEKETPSSDDHQQSITPVSTPTKITPRRRLPHPNSPNPGGVRYSYPLLYVSPCGTISVIFQSDLIVEMTVDKTIRVLCPGKFSAATNARGSSSCIMHPKARIFQADTHVFCEIEEKKMAVIGSQGVIFTMKGLPHSYLVSSTIVNGTTPILSQYIKYPIMKNDFTLSLLYGESECGEAVVPRCYNIVNNAKYDLRDDGIIAVTINGILIKQFRNGDLAVHNRPRSIRVSPSNKTVYIRTHYVDMGIQEDSKVFVKRGVKRVHSSRSGVVVSDGNCITAMDHYGRIVSST